MKVIIEPTLSDFIEIRLMKAYNKGGKYLQQGILFRSRLYAVLKEFEDSDLSECITNNDGSLSYTPSDGYLCTMNFHVGHDDETNTDYLILNTLDWDLNEWVFGYFIQILNERKKSFDKIITETINDYLRKNLLLAS